MSDGLRDTTRSSKCWATSASAIISSARRSSGHGNSSPPATGSTSRRKNSRSPSTMTTTRPMRSGPTRWACPRPGSRGWVRRTTSGPPVPPARAPMASAAPAARFFIGCPTAATWRSGTSSSPSSTASAHHRTTCTRSPAATSTLAWAWSGRQRCCRESTATSTSTSSSRSSKRWRRSATVPTSRRVTTAAGCGGSPITSAPAHLPSTRTCCRATTRRNMSSSVCCGEPCSTAGRWA